MSNVALEPAAGSSPHAEVRQGDAWDLLGQLEPESVDLIVTSPPYWGLRGYGLAHNAEILTAWNALGQPDSSAPGYEWYRDNGGVLGLEPYPEWFTAHLAELLTRSTKALKPGGSMWVNIGDTYFARWSSIRDDGRQGLSDGTRARRRTPMGGFRQEKQLLLIPSRFAIEMQNRRWILRNDLIWHKSNVPPRPEKDRLRLSHEHFFHFVKKPSSGRATYYYDISAAEPGALDVVTTLARSGQDGHSATFPLNLIEPRIATSCPPGGLVLDPFCGTGRSLTAALGLGRNAIGFELSPSFATSARTNVSRALAGTD